MTRARLRSEIDSAELTDWQAYEQLNGLPLHRAEAQRAIVGALLGSAWGYRGTPSDLIPQFDKTGGKPSLTLKQSLDIWANGINARRAG